MNIVRAASLQANSPILSNLERTEDLALGLFVYGAAIPVEAMINSVDFHTQVTLSKLAIGTGTMTLEFTSASPGVYHERVLALADARNVIHEYGDLLMFKFRDEGSVERDGYGSVSRRKPDRVLALRAHPVEFGPTEKKLEKAGIKEACDVLIYTAMQDWIENGIDFRDIEMATRTTVSLQGATYQVKSKGLSGQFGDSHLYVTFGLDKS